MTSSIPAIPHQLTSYVCPDNKTAGKCYKAGLAHEKLASHGPKHVDIAIGCLQKAAEKGEVKAWVDLARVILKHKPEFIGEAIKALEKLPPHTYPEADHLMADIYLTNNGVVPKDINRAIDHLLHCNDSMAARRLVGIYLSLGEDDKAIAILEKRAKKNDPWCCLKLGLICFTKGDNRAEGLLNKGKFETADAYARMNGKYDRTKLFFLNEPLWKEANIVLNKIQAAKHTSSGLEEAKRQFEASEKNENDINRLYRNYTQVYPNILAIKVQYKEEYRDLGRLAYRNGDEEDAFDYWRTGAAAGSKECLYYLGVCYYTGRGCDKDKAYAEKVWREAAEGTDACALAYAEVARMDAKLTASDGEEMGPLPMLPQDNVTRTGIRLDDKEEEDRIMADKPWHNRAVHWIRGIKSSTIAATAAAVGMIAFVAIGIFGIYYAISQYASLPTPVIATNFRPMTPQDKLAMEAGANLVIGIFKGIAAILGTLK